MPTKTAKKTMKQKKVQLLSEPAKCRSCGSYQPMTLRTATIGEGQNVPTWICDDCGHAHLAPIGG